MATIKVTIFFEKRLWVGTFERTDKEGYAVARHIFGKEPSDPEIHEFVLNNYHELKFGAAKNINIQIQRKNPKRVQREIHREMEKIKETARPSTLAQDYMREELEKKKKEKKSVSSAQMHARKVEQFAIKQQKKKKKKQGR
ncbi:MAG TPA: YjdF family protein [Chlamydiales bacterium]|nr:YjdF family protein [Chlamydiales bacterium]HPE84556.1 YjdF family protein [Chlamydiales bacterium]